MPNWITITAEDLQKVRAAKLVEAMASKALGDTQDDPTPATIATVVTEIRAAIAFSGRYVLDANTATIPASLTDLALLSIARRLKGRLLMQLTDAEREDGRSYDKRLEQLTQGKWPVETPDTPIATPTVQSAGGCQVIRPSSSRFSRSGLSGL